ncbi:sensitive to high expression 9-like protein [Kibdelosporangium persicum]|uniref:sensitive to high expression protein 9 homolog n=1 Tax=Kibdelosporangium persicum TaxID=2698649 RepID=UPI001FE8851B|nr:sensitive to high expression protein 9 homolog [Kibdelosporangium persicum]
MALFGNKESAEIASLHQQLAAANGTVTELRSWVNQLRGTQAPALEAELRLLKTAVDQAKREYAALTSSRHQTQAELDALQARLIETRETALLQEVGVYETRIHLRTHSPTRRLWPTCARGSRPRRRRTR